MLIAPSTEHPVRVVIDTDAANEIDDQFALAWALSSPDRLTIEAVTAAPYSHGHYLAALLAAQRVRSGGAATAFEELANTVGSAAIAEMSEQYPPAIGMERSLEEIERVLDAAAPARRPPSYRGAERFLADHNSPVDSNAARCIIALAHASDDPLYVAVLGAPTNVASALLIDPTIAAKLVVVFVAGYPSACPHVDDSFNLVQDRHAANELFREEPNLLYIPGYQVAETLSVSLPELEQHVAGTGPLGDLLVQLYHDNPLAQDPTQPGHSWVMWDLAPIAWLIEPSWVRRSTVDGANIGPDHQWHQSPGVLEEASRIDRRCVYTDFFERLARPR